MEEATYSTDALICPYCGHENRPEDSGYALCDENLEDFECTECEEVFKVRVYKSFSWTPRIFVCTNVIDDLV